MLILARLDGVTRLDCVSLSPRNDGPLIEGGSTGTTGAEGLRAVSVDARGGTVSGRADGVDATPTACLFCDGAGARSVVPHIPQKRLSSGLSLPQRGQRTDSPGPV